MQAQHPLKTLCENWRRKIRKALKWKKALFGDDAAEAMRFLDGPHGWMFEGDAKKTADIKFASDPDGEQLKAPSIQIQINKVAEVRDLFGPALYHHNPTILVTPHDPPQIPPEALGLQPPQIDPMTGMPVMVDPVWQEYEQLSFQQQTEQKINQTRAAVLQYLLNYMQRETDKKTHMRQCIDEALIKGLGIMFHELEQEEGFRSARIGSFYKDVDDLVIDPDAHDWEDVMWMGLRCVYPIWRWERDYNRPVGSLKDKGTDESLDRQADNEGHWEANDERKRGKSNDLLRGWKIWSKMGFGDRLKDSKKNWSGVFDELGDYCYLVIVDNVPYPLNLPDELLEIPEDDTIDAESYEFALPREPVMETVLDPLTQQPVEQPAIDPETGEPVTQVKETVFLACQWPIPFWADQSWPFEPLGFHWKPGSVWPISHIKPAIGELRFINYMMSYLAVKIKKSSCTTVAIAAGLQSNLKEQLLSGRDYNVVEIEEAVGRDIKTIVSFLEHPDWHPEIWNVVNAVFDLFDKRTGLTELMYGQSDAQFRSATEANVKQQNLAVRPDDMAGKVEDFASRVAAKEAMAMRWLFGREDVEPHLGPLGAYVWEQALLSSDVETVVREFDYEVRAGSTRKPDTATRAEQATEALQVWLPICQTYLQMTGDPTPINQLSQFWRDASASPWAPQFQPPPPQPMPQQAPPSKNGQSRSRVPV